MIITRRWPCRDAETERTGTRARDLIIVISPVIVRYPRTNDSVIKRLKINVTNNYRAIVQRGNYPVYVVCLKPRPVFIVGFYIQDRLKYTVLRNHGPIRGLH